MQGPSSIYCIDSQHNSKGWAQNKRIMLRDKSWFLTLTTCIKMVPACLVIRWLRPLLRRVTCTCMLVQTVGGWTQWSSPWTGTTDSTTQQPQTTCRCELERLCFCGSSNVICSLEFSNSTRTEFSTELAYWQSWPNSCRVQWFSCQNFRLTPQKVGQLTKFWNLSECNKRQQRCSTRYSYSYSSTTRVQI